MADTESLGAAGVEWLERLAALPADQRRVRIPTITDPRGTDFAAARAARSSSPGCSISSAAPSPRSRRSAS